MNAKNELARQKLFSSLKQAPHGVMADGALRDAVRGFFALVVGLGLLAAGAVHFFPLLAR